MSRCAAGLQTTDAYRMRFHVWACIWAEAERLTLAINPVIAAVRSSVLRLLLLLKLLVTSKSWLRVDIGDDDEKFRHEHFFCNKCTKYSIKVSQTIGGQTTLWWPNFSILRNPCSEYQGTSLENISPLNFQASAIDKSHFVLWSNNQSASDAWTRD